MRFSEIACGSAFFLCVGLAHATFTVALFLLLGCLALAKCPDVCDQFIDL